jgi:hypothetical protein
MVVSFPGVSDEIAAFVVEKIGGSAALSGPRLPVLDSRFIDPLRRLQAPARLEVETSDPELCLPTGPKFSTLVQRAGESIDRLKYEEAAGLLARARRALVCGEEVVSQELLGRYLFYSALIQFDGHKDGTATLADALTIAPGLPFPADYGEDVQKGFQEAQKQQSWRARTPVSIQLSGLGGSTLRIDGTPAKEGSMELPEGLHFLQQVGPDGRAFVGAAAALSAVPDAPPIQWPPREMWPASQLGVRAQLEQAVQDGAPNPRLKRGLDELMISGHQRWILFILRETGSSSVKVLEVETPTGGIAPQTYALTIPPGLLAPPSQPEPTSKAEQEAASGEKPAQSQPQPTTTVDQGTTKPEPGSTVDQKPVQPRAEPTATVHRMPAQSGQEPARAETTSQPVRAEATSRPAPTPAISATELESQTAPERPRGGGHKAGRIVGSFLWTSAFIGGAYYGFTFYTLNAEKTRGTSTLSQTEFNELKDRGYIAGGIGLGCAVTALVITIATTTSHPADTSGTSLHLTGGPGDLGLALAGEW